MGSLVMITCDDLLMKFAKDNDLGKYEIIVSSHELGGSLKFQKTEHGYPQAVDYESKYENIEFVPSLRPTVAAMEHAFSPASKETFISLYNSQLLGALALTDMCCIIDMIVTHDCDVLLVMAAYEAAGCILEYLQVFIKDEFLVQSYLFSDLEKLVNAYGTPIYDRLVKSLDFEVPKEFDGTNIDVIVKNIGDVDKIKEKLELEKGVAVSLSASADAEETFGEMFFNRFTEVMEEQVKEMLHKRDFDEIKEVCRNKGIRIAPHSTKDTLINDIIHNMRMDSAKSIKRFN